MTTEEPTPSQKAVWLIIYGVFWVGVGMLISENVWGLLPCIGASLFFWRRH